MPMFVDEAHMIHIPQESLYFLTESPGHRIGRRRPGCGPTQKLRTAKAVRPQAGRGPAGDGKSLVLWWKLVPPMVCK